MVLPYVTIPSINFNIVNHNSTCIFLHGLGDSGNGWASVAQILSKKLTKTKFILPHAPNKKVTRNGGVSMPAWYDIISLDEKSPQDKEGILQSAKSILEIVAQEESKGIPRDRIVIGGFSQGGVIALTTGLLFKSISESDEKKFAGILALSTYLPIHEHFSAHQKEIPTETKIYMAHGKDDQIISHKWAEMSRSYLKNNLMCSNVEFESFPHLGHSVNDKEIESIAKFLLKVFQY